MTSFILLLVEATCMEALVHLQYFPYLRNTRACATPGFAKPIHFHGGQHVIRSIYAAGIYKRVIVYRVPPGALMEAFVQCMNDTLALVVTLLPLASGYHRW